MPPLAVDLFTSVSDPRPHWFYNRRTDIVEDAGSGNDLGRELRGMTSPDLRPASALNLKFISHGTLESRDLDQTRKFYEEFLGFEVVRASARSLWARLGGD